MRRKVSFELVVLVIVAVASAAATSVIGLSTLHQSHEGAVAKQALCALKVDLEKRVDQTDKFLRHHPEGFAGIPAATLRASLQNQQATLKSLSSLHCERSTP